MTSLTLKGRFQTTRVFARGTNTRPRKVQNHTDRTRTLHNKTVREYWHVVISCSDCCGERMTTQRAPDQDGFTPHGTLSGDGDIGSPQILQRTGPPPPHTHTHTPKHMLAVQRERTLTAPMCQVSSQFLQLCYSQSVTLHSDRTVNLCVPVLTINNDNFPKRQLIFSEKDMPLCYTNQHNYYTSYEKSADGHF